MSVWRVWRGSGREFCGKGLEHYDTQWLEVRGNVQVVRLGWGLPRSEGGLTALPCPTPALQWPGTLTQARMGYRPQCKPRAGVWGAALLPTKSLPRDAGLFLEPCAPSPGETSPRILEQRAPPCPGSQAVCPSALHQVGEGLGWPLCARLSCPHVQRSGGLQSRALRSVGMEGGGDARAGGPAGEPPAHSTHTCAS